MKLYFPESKDQIDYVGYNHAVSLFNKALSDKIVDDPKKADFRVYCNLPWYHSPKKLKEKLPLMVYTMYESDKIPNNWRDFLNKHADIILVPSEWCRKNFINSGVKKPIYILSLGYDSDLIKKVEKIKSNLYVFLWQGVTIDIGGRKGVDKVIKAFKELKKEKRLDDDARLILKVMPHPRKRIDINHVETKKGIIYIQQELSRNELLELYETVDCCINPTSGEGFGLIPLEQMAMGKPVIVTDWSMSYLEKGCYIPLKYEIKKSNVFWNHRFFSFHRNGIAINFGGLPYQIPFFPMRMKLRPDGDKVQSVTKDGIVNLKMSIFKRYFNKFMNILYYLQGKTGFYFNGNRKEIFVLSENTGKDAHILIEDLKDKMEWCYKNRESAYDIGFLAHEYVNRNWTLERMKEDFEIIEDQLSKIYNFKKES